MNRLLGLNLRHFIFFITFEWVQKAKVFVFGKPFQSIVMQHSSLLCPFVSYKAKENGHSWL